MTADVCEPLAADARAVASWAGDRIFMLLCMVRVEDVRSEQEANSQRPQKHPVSGRFLALPARTTRTGQFSSRIIG